MWNLDTIPCGDTLPHDWHSDGRRYCPGTRPKPTWQQTAEDRGLNLEAAVELDYFSELDQLARDHGLTGDTYATGGLGYEARRAYLEVDGTLYVSPARYDSFYGSWPAPGAAPRTPHSSEVRSDRRADHEEWKSGATDGDRRQAAERDVHPAPHHG